MNSGDVDIIIVRETMLAENFGAHLWSIDNNVDVLRTKAQVTLSTEELESIAGKRILIVGGYYRSCMDDILSTASAVWVFHNHADTVPDDAKYNVLRPTTEDRGFATFAFDLLPGWRKPRMLRKMVEYLDSYLYGWPSEKAMCFQNGVYVIDKPTDLEKLMTIECTQALKQTIVNGTAERLSNIRIAEQRLEASIDVSLAAYSLVAKLGFGDSPIVDSCRMLAQKSESGVGILVRYDLSANRTLFSIGTTQ